METLQVQEAWRKTNAAAKAAAESEAVEKAIGKVEALAAKTSRDAWATWQQLREDDEIFNARERMKTSGASEWVDLESTLTSKARIAACLADEVLMRIRTAQVASKKSATPRRRLSSDIANGARRASSAETLKEGASAVKVNAAGRPPGMSTIVL